MRSIFVMLLLAVGSAGAVGQATVCYPDNLPNAGGFNSFPFGTNFGGTNWRYQLRIPASALPSGPVRVTEVAFAPGGNGTFSASDFQLRAAHTTNASLSTCFFQNIGQCPTELISVQGRPGFSWTVTANTWDPIGTRCDFGYDGQRSIVLEIRYRNRTSGFLSSRIGNVERTWANDSTAPPAIDPYSAVCGQSDNSGMKVCLTYEKDTVLLASDTVSLGSAFSIQMVNCPTGPYRIAASFGQGPPIVFAKDCRLCLQVDGLFWASLLVGPPMFAGYSGTIRSGTANARMSIPAITLLVGVCLFHGGVVLDRAGQIQACSNTAGTVIVP